jgi:hypothetical protein
VEDLLGSGEWFLEQQLQRYHTLEEAVEEFNQFLADEAMAYQGMVV